MIVARAAALLMLVGGSAFAQAKPAVVPAIAQNDLAKVATKTRAIHAEPSTITLRVGETVVLEKITVTVLDSLGNVRGRLVGYDFSIPKGQAATAEPFKITGVTPGTAELIIHFPSRMWAPRTDPLPEARVKVIVKP